MRRCCWPAAGAGPLRARRFAFAYGRPCAKTLAKAVHARCASGLQCSLVVSLSDIPGWVYKLLLVLATCIWGYSYLVTKDLLATVAPSWLVGIRSLSAGVILGLVLLPRLRRCLSPRMVGAGVALGVLDFIAQLAQTIGLTATTPGVSAFLTATYCIIVPFAWWVLARRRPTSFNVVAACVALVGIWLVSVSAAGETLAIGFGEGMTLVCAFFYAVHIVFVSFFSRDHDVLVLTVLQFLVEGALGCVLGAGSGAQTGLASLTPTLFAQLAYLVLLCCIACFAIQNVALAYVPPAQASLLLSLESVFGVLFSVLLYGEQLTSRLVVGFVLIFAAVLVSEALPGLRKGHVAKRD